jgi:deazaflavin-dependent oxidoreductase (nitroreductase family)
MTSPAFREPTAIEKSQPFLRILVSLGLGPSHIYLLQVRGRKSGKLFSTPVDLLDLQGNRYLVAPRGRTQWIRNAEAAGEITLRKGSTVQRFRLRPMADTDKPQILKACRRKKARPQEGALFSCHHFSEVITVSEGMCYFAPRSLSPSLASDIQNNWREDAKGTASDRISNIEQGEEP